MACKEGDTEGGGKKDEEPEDSARRGKKAKFRARQRCAHGIWTMKRFGLNASFTRLQNFNINGI